MYDNWKKVQNYLLLAKKELNEFQITNKDIINERSKIRSQFNKKFLKDRNEIIEKMTQYRLCKFI